MSIHTIKMPDIGEGIAEVELVAWHVKPGDVVKEDQVLADVMTDKANVEIPSPVNGTVLSLGGTVGQVLAVGSALIQIEVAEMAEAGAVRRAQQAGVMEASHPTVVPPPPLGERETTRPIASPSVRRRAWELGVDLEQVRGTGAGGRIMHGDLEVHLAKHGSTLPKPTTPAPLAGDEQQQIPIIGLRRKIAQKMQESKRRIPHFSYVEEIDVTDAEALRAQLNERFSPQRGKLTMLPFIARAIVIALRDFPQINARFDDEAGVVTRYGAVHIGIATQTESGLMVPVMRHAQSLDLWGMAREIERLARASRAGKVTRDELAGSTITISSLGALGGIASTPVINHPEVAIVGVNRIVERPVYRHHTIVPRQLMNLSSSFDHRVVDGMDAARFIQAVRSLLEVPAGLFVD